MLQSRLGEIVSGKTHESSPLPANTSVVDIRQKAIEVALSVTSGAYQTSLLSYFTHRDLFPSLMKVGSLRGN